MKKAAGYVLFVTPVVGLLSVPFFIAPNPLIVLGIYGAVAGIMSTMAFGAYLIEDKK